MHELIMSALSLLLGLAAGFIGGIATGGGMISIPGLIFLGLSPSAAIATTSLTSVSSLTSAFRYHRSKMIRRQYLGRFLALTFLGSTVGSLLLLQIDPGSMQRIFGIVCILLALVFTFNKTSSIHKTGKLHTLSGLVALVLASVFAGFFGTGGGFFVTYILSYFYGMSIIEANANSKIINMGGAAATILIFLHAGIINFNIGIPLMIGSAIGGYIGAHTAIKKGDTKVKAIFLVVVIISGTKLLLA